MRDLEFLSKKSTGLLLIDIQEKLFPKVFHHEPLQESLVKIIDGLKVFEIPILVTEQYPQGLGNTILELKKRLSHSQILAKTTFSCLGDPAIKQLIEKLPITTWILAGIETHICLLQTAKELLKLGKQVVVAFDATSSRSKENYDCAMNELRTIGARVTSIETLLFELTQDAKTTEFKTICKLVK